MLPDELDTVVKKKLIAVLERTISDLSEFVRSEHRFRFVSSAQSLPYTSAFAEWVKNGEKGPQPSATVAEMRAAVYDQAESASELRAFSKVASVAAVELGEATLAGLKFGQVIVTYTALRGFIEEQRMLQRSLLRSGRLRMQQQMVLLRQFWNSVRLFTDHYTEPAESGRSWSILTFGRHLSKTLHM